jgi:hypothetical protein
VQQVQLVLQVQLVRHQQLRDLLVQLVLLVQLAQLEQPEQQVHKVKA